MTEKPIIDVDITQCHTREELDSAERRIKSVISATQKEIGHLYAKLNDIRYFKDVLARKATLEQQKETERLNAKLKS